MGEGTWAVITPRAIFSGKCRIGCWPVTLKREACSTELDFPAMKETRIDELFAAWLELTEDQRNEMDADFSEIHALSCEKGWCAIRDEAQWKLRGTPEQHVQFVERLAALDGSSLSGRW